MGCTAIFFLWPGTEDAALKQMDAVFGHVNMAFDTRDSECLHIILLFLPAYISTPSCIPRINNR